MRKFFLILCFCYATLAQGGEFGLRLGPAGAGNGGANPLGIPPGPTDLDFTYLSRSGFESNLSLIPGLLFGKRSQYDNGFYMSLGGGIVLDANDVGPGGYCAVGIDLFESTVKFNIELKQALGITGSGLISPYAFRLGAMVDFN